MELLFAITVYFVFWYTYVDTLWDQDYINIIVNDWKQNPITDFKRIQQTGNGKINWDAPDCPKGYEITN